MSLWVFSLCVKFWCISTDWLQILIFIKSNQNKKILTVYHATNTTNLCISCLFQEQTRVLCHAWLKVFYMRHDRPVWPRYYHSVTVNCMWAGTITHSPFLTQVWGQTAHLCQYISIVIDSIVDDRIDRNNRKELAPVSVLKYLYRI